MTRTLLSEKIIGLILLATVMLIGCRSSAPPVQFYTLSATRTQTVSNTITALKPISVGVGPVAIPEVLDRPQIVVRTSPNKLKIDEFHRWAEPLKDSFGRVLADNLAILLKTVDVYQYRQRRDVPVDFQVEISVSRFFADADGTAVLAAYWSVVGNNGKTVLSRKRSSISEKAVSRDFEAVVAAQNKTLQELSEQVAAEIQKLR